MKGLFLFIFGLMESTTQFAFLNALTKFVQNHLRAHVLIDGIVTAVNDDFTCDITVQNVPYSSVPIKVLKGSQASIYEIPVINTKCLVKWRDGNRGLPQIDSFDKVEDYYVEPKTNLFISAKKTEFNGGENGGMVLVNPLVTKVNNIENLLNNLITQYNSHTHILTLTSGTGTAAETLSQEAGEINPITKASDIESTVITQ